MSKLADLIQRATRPASAPLGFGSARAKAPPSMIAVAVAGSKWKDAASDAVSSGADAVLLFGGPSGSDAKAAVEAAGDRPCGLVTNDISGLGDAGIDFAVVGGDTPASALQNDDLAFLLQVDEGLSDIQLRTIEALPVDALYLDAPASALTIGRQMELQRITGLARKPLLTAPAPGVDKDGLLALRDAGALLLAVDMSASDAKQALQRLRELIDGLPARRERRRGEKADVTIPTVAAAQHDHDEEDDYDE